MNLNEQRDTHFELASDYFSMLSEPTRLKILTTLGGGELAVGDIVARLDSSQPNVSRQLNALYKSRIVARRKVGTQVYYRIRDAEVIDLCRGICRKMVMAHSGASSCRSADNSCSLGGAECRWQMAASDRPSTGSGLHT